MIATDDAVENRVSGASVAAWCGQSMLEDVYQEERAERLRLSKYVRAGSRWQKFETELAAPRWTWRFERLARQPGRTHMA